MNNDWPIGTAEVRRASFAPKRAHVVSFSFVDGLVWFGLVVWTLSRYLPQRERNHEAFSAIKATETKLDSFSAACRCPKKIGIETYPP